MMLVTGATGQIGRLVLEHLLDRNIPVRAFVRNEHAFREVENPLLQVSIGTFEDKESIAKAVEGVERLFLVARDNPEQVIQHENVIRVAEQSGVKQIVKLSAFGASITSSIALMRWHGETEEQLKESNVKWTFLRPHLYMQNLLRFGEEAATNQSITAPMGSERYSLVDIRDIAEVAAKVLYTRNHEEKSYTLTGPTALAYQEIAKQLSDILGHSILYKQTSQNQFYEMQKENGTPS